MRSCGAIWLAPIFLVAPPQPAFGEAWIDVLDVGQGLAIVVRTMHHALVYDTGPLWSGESSSGQRIVVPYLRGEGVRSLDGIVVSHADDDHSGGTTAVAMRRDPAWLMSSLPEDHPLQLIVARSLRCVAGTGWRWDGVDFAMLHPAAAMYEDGRKVKENDRSCVLRIASAAGAVLLPADLEAKGEAELRRRAGAGLRSDVLLVPHHGSRTSSTDGFLDAVAPSIAVASLGHRNRFNHPHPSVLARYQARGIAWRRTDLEGALRIVLPAEVAAQARVESIAPPVRYWSDRRICVQRGC
jgi:competence protein ComEC